MGARGPKRGFKTIAAVANRATAAAALPKAKSKPKQHRAKPAAPDPQPDLAMTVEEASRLPAAYRENPAKLGGEALRRLGHIRGMARSHMATMTDEQVRAQLKFITSRQYEEQEQ